MPVRDVVIGFDDVVVVHREHQYNLIFHGFARVAVVLDAFDRDLAASPAAFVYASKGPSAKQWACSSKAEKNIARTISNTGKGGRCHNRQQLANLQTLAQAHTLTHDTIYRAN